MKIAFRNSDTAVKKETWHYLKKKTPIEMFDQISLIINPCLLNPTKMKYIKFFFKPWNSMISYTWLWF